MKYRETIYLTAQNFLDFSPAIEWIMERYAVTTDKKKSGIVNDPNDWCTEHNNPRYIIDLIKRIVTVSVKTVKITRSLPKLEEL